jgi:hypothetical protein
VTRFELHAWSAWAPGLATRDEWRAWAAAPSAPPTEGAPEVRFIPAMARRRLSRIAKMTMQVAYEVATPGELRELPLVFASRHAEVCGSLQILRDIVADLPLSPTAFSHSVHNAPPGQLSIQTGNRRPAVSVAAQRATFAAGLVESLALSHRLGGDRVLFLSADEIVPAEFAHFADEPHSTCATACVLSLPSPTAAGEPLSLTPLPRAASAEWREPPDVLRFLAWLAGGAREVELEGTGGTRWRVERGG